MRHPGIKWRQWNIIWYFLSRWYRNWRCIYQLLKFTLLKCHEMSRQRFKELEVTCLIWNPIHLASLSSTNCFPIYEVFICRSSSKSSNKSRPPTLPITNPMIWYILHAKLICNIDWSHPKIIHMNDIETMKCHVHSLLLNFTVYFILDWIPINSVRQSWNNVHWICAIKTTLKCICTCCVTLHNRHFYLSSHFVLFFLALNFLMNNFLWHTSSMCPSHTIHQFLFQIWSPA